LGDWTFRTSKNTLNGGARRRNIIRMRNATSKLPPSLIGLVATVDAIPQDVFVALSELGPNVDDDLLDVEQWTEMLRDVGFQSAPKNAEDFVQSFIVDRRVRRGSLGSMPAARRFPPP